MPKPAPIIPLPPDVIAQLKAATQITSLNGVVLELLRNAIDAGAQQAEINVDFGRGGCVIEDDGAAIPPAEFTETGGLCKPYYTSKYAAQDDCFGRNGLFLASLASLSLFSVASKHPLHEHTSSLTVHHGSILSRAYPAPPAQELQHGTRVTVRDLFGNMPVRVKQRGLLLDANGETARLWEQLKRNILALLIAWGRAVCIHARDQDGAKIFVLNGFRASVQTPLDGRTIISASSSLRLVLSLLAQSSLIASDSWPSWIPASASSSTVSIKGAISLDPAPSRNLQFISLGIHPVSLEKNNELYNLANRLFSSSHFGVEDSSESSDLERGHRKRVGKLMEMKTPVRAYRSLGKGVDRHPQFWITIKLKNAKSNKLTEDVLARESVLKDVADVLEAMIVQWLEVHHFQPKLKRRGVQAGKGSIVDRKASQDILGSSNTDTISDAACGPTSTSTHPNHRKRRRNDPASGHSSDHEKTTRLQLPYRASDYFSSWSRIKSSHPSFYDKLWQKQEEGTPKAHLTTVGAESSNMNDLNDESLDSRRAEPCNRVREGASGLKDTQAHDSTHKAIGDYGIGLDSSITSNTEDDQPEILVRPSCSDDTMVWQDPITQEAYLVNSRTGMVMPKAQDISTPTTSGCSKSLPGFVKPIRLVHRKSLAERQPGGSASNGWLLDFLKDWENPVFKPQTEAPIPTIPIAGLLPEFSQSTADRLFAEQIDNIATRLDKSSLVHAHVIAQVDKKFILIRAQGIPEKPTSDQSDNRRDTLVLIDQHAASERVTLELLLNQLFLTSDGLVDSVSLSEPLIFAVPLTEIDPFRAFEEEFMRWGISYEISVSNSAKSIARGHQNECHISVTTLPTTIATRGQAEPKLIIDLLRQHVHTLHTTEFPLVTSSQALHRNDDNQWLHHIPRMPKKMMEMINSRACRSAIMFNDDLTKDECTKLIQQLSSCVFPFVCAHGRPSLAILGGIEEGLYNKTRNSNDGYNKSFAHAYNAWKGRSKAISALDKLS